MNEKKHIVFENIHVGTYKETSRQARIDTMSLTCIECHDTYINEPVKFLGPGVWLHANARLNHPVGISYKKISAKKFRDFQPSLLLSKKLKLFDGKIGCGTCHNIYSKEKFKLVRDNIKSGLCFECHIK
jgi:predicted CXXCH cytochrome family protein